MTKNAKIAVALVGGYVLGRTKKAKLALGLGMFLAGKKLDLDPRRVGKLIANSPALGGLNDQVRSQLVDATRTAATEALTQRAAGLASSLARRTEALQDPTGVTDAARDEDGEDADDAEGSAESAESADSDSGDEEPARRKSSGAGGRSPAKRTRSSAEGGARRTAGTARKRTGAAKSAATKASGARSAKKRTTSTRKSGGDSDA
ncbi:hypothetical protein IF655_11250 [Streptomyces sp. DSM 110735]|uniref:hypothetical protein n=1 Tax=Streptomyces sp. DSM 110735 TaxID=2775031 RepID=UPI0018F7AE4C|nr:hypothetical protein [Streptomyces sp. DSM 110735]MBJ7903874.1 hypothetical protein [Streptomyces sp. DSM 110735]